MNIKCYHRYVAAYIFIAVIAVRSALYEKAAARMIAKSHIVFSVAVCYINYVGSCLPTLILISCESMGAIRKGAISLASLVLT